MDVNVPFPTPLTRVIFCFSIYNVALWFTMHGLHTPDMPQTGSRVESDTDYDQDFINLILHSVKYSQFTLIIVVTQSKRHLKTFISTKIPRAQYALPHLPPPSL